MYKILRVATWTPTCCSQDSFLLQMGLKASCECDVYALFWYILFNVFRKRRLILLCITLEIHLYHLRWLLVCLQLPALNCEIARQEKSWVLFSFKNRHCWFGTWQPYWLSPSTTIIFHRFFQKCKFARLYLSFYSTQVVSWDIEWQSQKFLLLWFFKNLKTLVNQKFWLEFLNHPLVEHVSSEQQ